MSGKLTDLLVFDAVAAAEEGGICWEAADADAVGGAGGGIEINGSGTGPRGST